MTHQQYNNIITDKTITECSQRDRFWKKKLNNTILTFRSRFNYNGKTWWNATMCFYNTRIIEWRNDRPEETIAVNGFGERPSATILMCN